MSDWDKKLSEQVNRRWENYKKKRIDLGTVQDNLKLDLSGEFFYIEAVSSPSAAATVRLNRNTNEALVLSLHTKIETVFICLYLTHAAQAGEWIDIIVGVDFDKSDAFTTQAQEPQAVVELTHASANTNVTPSAAIAGTVIIKSHSRNTDIAWIDFGQAAVQDSCLPLEPGDSITVPVSNLDRINANFEVGGESVWIVNLL